jgi:hypothetical protein
LKALQFVERFTYGQLPFNSTLCFEILAVESKSVVFATKDSIRSIARSMDELQRLINKKQFFLELNEAIEELNLISEGKSSARSAEDCIHELQN